MASSPARRPSVGARMKKAGRRMSLPARSWEAGRRRPSRGGGRPVHGGRGPAAGCPCRQGGGRQARRGRGPAAGCPCQRGGRGSAAGGPRRRGGSRPARGGRGPAAGCPRRKHEAFIDAYLKSVDWDSRMGVVKFHLFYDTYQNDSGKYYQSRLFFLKYMSSCRMQEDILIILGITMKRQIILKDNG